MLELEESEGFAEGLPFKHSEKTGPLETCLKNVLENFKVYCSQITEDLECQEEKFRLYPMGNWQPLENFEHGGYLMKLVF